MGHRWRVNGLVKTWKRNDQRIQVPLKHGLYSYDYLSTEDFTDGECDFMTLENELPR